MLNKISQAQKAKYCMFSFIETRPKIMLIMMMILGHECIWGVWGSVGEEGEKERILRSEEGESKIHVYI
jgi:hypothetical protein